jgi:hypothetical protein
MGNPLQLPYWKASLLQMIKYNRLWNFSGCCNLMYAGELVRIEKVDDPQACVWIFRPVWTLTRFENVFVSPEHAKLLRNQRIGRMQRYKVALHFREDQSSILTFTGPVHKQIVLAEHCPPSNVMEKMTFSLFRMCLVHNTS